MYFTKLSAIALALTISLFSAALIDDFPSETKPGVYSQDPPPSEDPPREPTDEWDEAP